MNEDTETVSIDLTEDYIEFKGKQTQVQLENCNIRYGNTVPPHNKNQPDSSAVLQTRVLNEHQDKTLEEKRVQSYLLPDFSEQSAISFVKDLQKENPQIETVFIESDEDEMKSDIRPQIKVHNMIIFNSKKNREVESPLLNVQNSQIACNNTTNSNSTLRETSSAGLKNENLSLEVRPISPSRFNFNFAKISSTISLQDETDVSSKKYLAIPKEIEPFLANIHSPITLNIPGIGPLLIPNPSDIFKPNSVSASVKVQCHESINKKVILPRAPREPVYDPLSDTKYCWRYQRNRKRDLEGFTMSDRLGFYKAEQQRSKMCAGKYNDLIKRVQSSINMKEKALMSIKNSRLNMKNVKLVEIDSIKKGKKKALFHKKQPYQFKAKVSPELSPLVSNPKDKFSQKISNFAPIQVSSESDSNQPDSDLLVTKKIVFINNTEHPRGRKRKRRQARFSNQHTKKLQKSSQNPSQNQMVVYQTASSLREKAITDIYLNDKNEKRKVDSHKPNLPSVSILPSDNESQNTQVKNFNKRRRYKSSDPRSLPYNYSKTSQFSIKESEEQSSHEEVHKIKPCYVEIPHNNLVQKALKIYNDLAKSEVRTLINTCKIIDNLKQFQQEIQPIKPMLIINEHHCAKMNFPQLFCNNNIIFPISQNTDFLKLNIKNRIFAESAKAGYIKFVKPRILCRYLAGFREV